MLNFEYDGLLSKNYLDAFSNDLWDSEIIKI